METKPTILSPEICDEGNSDECHDVHRLESPVAELLGPVVLSGGSPMVDKFCYIGQKQALVGDKDQENKSLEQYPSLFESSPQMGPW